MAEIKVSALPEKADPVATDVVYAPVPASDGVKIACQNLVQKAHGLTGDGVLTLSTDIITKEAEGTAFNKDFGTASDEVCEGDDSRLSDARTPLDHALDGVIHTGTRGTAFNKDFGSASDTVCEGDDSRLSDARTPTAHALDGAEHTGITGTTDNLMSISSSGKPQDAGGVLKSGRISVGSLAKNADASQTEAFATAFDSTPNVVAVVEVPDETIAKAAKMYCVVSNVTTTSFDWAVNNGVGLDPITDIYLHWHATNMGDA